MASAAAMAFITVFMLVYYRLSGVNAVVALAANLAHPAGRAWPTRGATLTLPGIAGIILTVGVGVDTNVLVFERIREELRNGKTVRAAVQNGFDRVWITILDTHATALIAAAFLFQFGTGPIKGFAVTLVMGLIANIFASYFVSKFLFEWVLGKRQVATAEHLGAAMEILKNPNFDFLGKARYFVAASVLVILAGVAYMRHPAACRYGVEFSGGTQLIVKFQNAPEVDRIRAAVEPVAPGAVIQTYGDPAKNQVLIRLAGGTDDAGELDATAERRAATRSPASYAENPVLESSSEIVGPVVGAELRRKAVQLTVLGPALPAHLHRRSASRARSGAPRPPWPSSTTCSSPSAFLAFFRYEITLNVIAALLTLVGYSVNDTIVIFDRARENLRHKRKDPLRKILNDSREPDPDPHPHLQRHHLPVRARPVPVRRRGAARASGSPWWSASWSGRTPRSTSRARSWSGGAAASKGGRRRVQRPRPPCSRPRHATCSEWLQ